VAYDHAQSFRITQRNGDQTTGIRVIESLNELPEVAYLGQFIYMRAEDRFRVYDGDGWQDMRTGLQTYVQEDEPTEGMVAGDSWLDPLTKVVKYYDGTAWVLPLIEGDQIDPNYASTIRISADQLQSGNLSGVIELMPTSSGQPGKFIAKNPTTGTEVQFGGDGFFVYGPTSENSKTYVQFPTTGQPNIISGTLQAETLTVDGHPITEQAATFRGNSQFEPEATLTLNNAVVAPVAAPTVEAVSNKVSTVTLGSTFTPSGLHASAWDGTHLYTVQRGTTGPNFGDQRMAMYRYDPVANTYTFVADLAYGYYWIEGIAFVGGTLYSLWTLYDNLFLVEHGDEAGGYANVNVLDLGFMDYANSTPTLSTDGTNLWVAYLANTPQRYIVFKQYSPALALLQTITTSTTIPYTNSVQVVLHSLVVGSWDWGDQTFYLTYGASSGKGLITFNSTGVRTASRDFQLMEAINPAFVYYHEVEERFYQFSRTNGSNYPHALFQYSKNFMDNSTAQWKISNTYYRPSGPEAETDISPEASLLMKSRWWWKVTTTTPPAGLQSRIYLDPNSSGTRRLQYSMDVGITSVTSDVFDMGGAAPRTDIPFAGATPSKIISQATDADSGATLPSIELRGDGYARIREIYSSKLLLTSTQDVTGDPGNTPPLRIGNINGSHLRMDGNEIQSMKSNTLNDWNSLYLNLGGGSVEVGGQLNVRNNGLNLGSNSRTIKRFDFGTNVVSLNASGYGYVTHSLGVVPQAVSLVPASNYESGNYYLWANGDTTASRIYMYCRKGDGTVQTGDRTVTFIAVSAS